MGKQLPSRLKEVVYTLSPFETTVMSGLWKDLPGKLHKKVSEVTFQQPWTRSGDTDPTTKACFVPSPLRESPGTGLQLVIGASHLHHSARVRGIAKTGVPPLPEDSV